MGAGARIEKAVLGISAEGSKMSAVIKDKIDEGVKMTKKRAQSVAGRTRNKAENLMFKVKMMIFNSIATLLTFVLIVALSLFFYGTFYYAFMPLQIYEEPINFQFQPCDNEPGVCSFPNASIELNRKIKLMAGLPYSISLRLEVPESTVNQNLGMFMTCMNLELQDKKEIQSCKSSILQFRSSFLIYLETLAFSPFLVSGTSSQKQYVVVNSFPKFYDDLKNPAAWAHIQIQSKFIQIYSAEVLVHAEFSGLRHIIYHHPWISTCIGVGGNFILLSTILLLSWSRLFASDNTETYGNEGSGLLGDISDAETELSLEEDEEVFWYSKDESIPSYAAQHEDSFNFSKDIHEEDLSFANHDQPNQEGDMDNKINTLVENLQ